MLKIKKRKKKKKKSDETKCAYFFCRCASRDGSAALLPVTHDHTSFSWLQRSESLQIIAKEWGRSKKKEKKE